MRPDEPSGDLPGPATAVEGSGGKGHRSSGWLPAACVALLALSGTGCGGGADDALARGDGLSALGQTTEAVAEYRLALRQRGESPEVLARLGRAYAARGEPGESSRYFARLLAEDSSYRHFVAAELVALARRGLEAGDRSLMARALEPVAELGIGLIPAELRLALAEEHHRQGEHRRALPLYLSVVEAVPEDEDGEGGAEFAAAGVPDSLLTPEVLYHLGRSYQEVGRDPGGCAEALPYYRQYLRSTRRSRPSADRSGAEWHFGTCLFAVARQERMEGAAESADEKLTHLIELGVPRTLMDRAHFERGEIRLSSGRPEDALRDFQEVLRLNPTRSGPVVLLAEQRIRQIRYGGG